MLPFTYKKAKKLKYDLIVSDCSKQYTTTDTTVTTTTTTTFINILRSIMSSGKRQRVTLLIGIFKNVLFLQ